MKKLSIGIVSALTLLGVGCVAQKDSTFSNDLCRSRLQPRH
jgi:hypothetical protein